MDIIKKACELEKEVISLKNSNLTIGFVPTMGALHQGHLSLIEQAKREMDVVIVSIFVNPTQFNNANDLKNYPRDNERDVKILESTACKILFLPDVCEIYPDESTKQSSFNFGQLTKIMEGKYRFGHFDGVALVVSKLFLIVKPDKAFFGQKDFQQLIIIKKLVSKYLSHLNIEVVRCPIVREKDGLAMSSRNILLNVKQRESATKIFKALIKAKNSRMNYVPGKLKEMIKKEIDADEEMITEYVEIVNDPDLKIIEQWNPALTPVVCVAVQLGSVRLIDNIYLK